MKDSVIINSQVNLMLGSLRQKMFANPNIPPDAIGLQSSLIQKSTEEAIILGKGMFYDAYM